MIEQEAAELLQQIAQQKASLEAMAAEPGRSAAEVQEIRTQISQLDEVVAKTNGLLAQLK